MSSTSYTALVPNHPSPSLLAQHLDKAIVRGENASESTCHCIGLRTLQTVATGVGIGGAVMFAPVSTQYAGSNTTYGSSLATGNVGSFSALIAWSILNITNEALSKKTDEEAALETAAVPLSKPGKALKVVAPLTIGLVCQAPFSYMAYKYNNKNLTYFFFTLGSDSWVPSYSLSLSVDALLRKSKLNPDDKILAGTKKLLIERLENNEQAILELPKDARKLQVQKLTSDLAYKNLTATLDAFFTPIGPEKPKESSARTWIRKVVAFGGLGLAFMRLYYLGALGSNGVIEMLNVPQLAGYVSGAIIGACNALLAVKSMVGTAKSTYDTVVNFFTGKAKNTLYHILAWKLNLALWVLAAALSGLSYGPSVQTPRDTFSGNFATAMEGLVSAGTILVALNAMGDLIHDAVLAYSGKWGSEEEKQLVELHSKYRKLIAAIDRAPLHIYASFLKELPQDKLTDLLGKAKITEESLNAYLQKCLSPAALQLQEADPLNYDPEQPSLSIVAREPLLPSRDLSSPDSDSDS